jgi:hypothetical protein
MVRIPGFHPGDPGSSPGYGNAFAKIVNQLYPQVLTLLLLTNASKSKGTSGRLV